VHVELELSPGSFNVHLEQQPGESIMFALSQTFERASSKGIE